MQYQQQTMGSRQASNPTRHGAPFLADSGKHFEPPGASPDSFIFPQQLITTPSMACATVQSMPGTTVQNNQMNSSQFNHITKKKSSVSALGHYEKNIPGYPNNSNNHSCSSKLILEPLNHSANQRTFAEEDQQIPNISHNPSSLMIARNQS